MVSPTEKFTDYLVDREIISENEKDLYAFGLEQGWFFMLNLATTMLIGWCFGMMWQGLLFLLAYLSLRSYSGGYHANTPVGCYIISTAIIILFCTLFYYSKEWPHEIILVLGIVSVIIIVLMTPVESKNKPLDSRERRVYKRRSIIVLFVQMVVALASEFTLPIIGLSMYFISVMLIAAKIQQYYENIGG